MSQDSEIQKLQDKKLQEWKKQQSLENANLDKAPANNCTNCGGLVEPALTCVLTPEHKFCPTCVIMAATAFVRSKSFMIEISSNKKKTFARVRQFNPKTFEFESQKIIDVGKMPVISIVGNIDFYKIVPAKGQKKIVQK